MAVFACRHDGGLRSLVSGVWCLVSSMPGARRGRIVLEVESTMIAGWIQIGRVPAGTRA
jgi:hypothetical protein